MYIFNRLTVVPKLPERIKGIQEIAENLWWCWNTESLKLFKKIDKELWERLEKNPIKFLKQISQTKLEEVAKDEEFLRVVGDTIEKKYVFRLEQKRTVKKIRLI